MRLRWAGATLRPAATDLRRRPGIHTPCRGYGLRARSLRSRPQRQALRACAGNGTPEPRPRLVRLHPLKFRQLMPEPGELPLGVMAGIGAGDRSRLFNANVAPEV